jgi:hypothetical protein
MPQLESQSAAERATDETSTARSDSAGFAIEPCRAWLDWAAAQVDASLARDAVACEQLLASLNELMGLAQVRSNPGSAPADNAMDRQMSAVILAVQGHDRVIQGLAHVAQSLRALHGLLGDARCAESSEAWHTLRQKQMRSFSMAEERVLFARMVAGDPGELPAVTPDDTVEFFGAEPG